MYKVCRPGIVDPMYRGLGAYEFEVCEGGICGLSIWGLRVWGLWDCGGWAYDGLCVDRVEVCGLEFVILQFVGVWLWFMRLVGLELRTWKIWAYGLWFKVYNYELWKFTPWGLKLFSWSFVFGASIF